MTEEPARRLEIFRMLLEIRGRAKMPELMRRHVNADMPLESVRDLLAEGSLARAMASMIWTVRVA